MFLVALLLCLLCIVPVSANNAIDDANSHCKTLPFNYTVTAKGCMPLMVFNNFCYGQCKSYFVPNHMNSKDPWYSCSVCGPVLQRTRAVYLKCVTQNGLQYKRLEMSVIVRCGCKAARCMAMLNYRSKYR